MSARLRINKQRKTSAQGNPSARSLVSARHKDMIREILHTMGRYLSLIIITALGSASVVGIQATSIDMRDVADKTIKERGLYDIQIKSTTGFSDDDLRAVINTHGVSNAMSTDSYDVYVYLENETYTMHTIALPENPDMNNVELIQGRLPQNSRECAVESSVLRRWNVVVGESITLGLDNMDDYYDVLDVNVLEIVGVVKAPFYIVPYNRGSTNLGNGVIDYYMYLHPDAYRLEIDTDIYLRIEEALALDNMSQAYFDSIDEWINKLEQVGELRIAAKEAEYSDAQAEIDDGWKEYYDGLDELEEKIADGNKELDGSKADLEVAAIELEDAQLTLEREINEASDEIDSNERELRNGYDELIRGRDDLIAGQLELNSARVELNGSLATLESIAPYGASPELDVQYEAIYFTAGVLSEKQLEIDSGLAELDAAERIIIDGLRQINEARETLIDEQADAQAEIDDGWVKYQKGLADWIDGEETLKREEFDARAELDEARVKLIDAQEKLDDAPQPEWYLFARKDEASFDSYYQDTLRLQSIGYIFPLVFFIVAILVSLTTMSRMVDEQRMQIGIYKALGYRSMSVVTKYIVYSATAGIIGGIAGVAGGSVIFPKVIFGAYLHLYDMPKISTPIPMSIAAIAIATSVGASLIVTVFTCLRSMRDTAATLMRPKAPPSGKRVLLERITPVWNRLSFTGKVTARNIFRYKKRLIMTLAGVAGCSALLLTAFGLRDSIGSVAGMQYGKLTSYVTRAYTKDIASERQRVELDSLMYGDWLYIREESIDVSGCSYSVSLIVPENTSRLPDFITLRSRKTGEDIPLGNDVILVSEKLARDIGLTVGDDLVFTAGNGAEYKVRTAGSVENYVQHHIFISPQLYNVLFGVPPVFNSILITADEEIAVPLLENSNVRGIAQTAYLEENIADATDALEIVTVVLIILACALAFVVLFNLTNINISERNRELATIKVLGFYESELAMYIYRENALVTLIGIVIGLFAGLFLNSFVLTKAEIDMLMFPHIIKPLSYVYSVALALLFAVIVNLVMIFKLARIDMVESLKSVE